MFLRTERLYLRNLRPEDAAAISAYREDPACAKYQRWGDTSVLYLTEFARRYGNCVFLSNQAEQHYAVCLTSGELVGDVSYFYTESDHCVTLGITIAPKYQRQGIAREILSAVITAVQNRHPQLDIVALIDPENEGSIALFENLGFYRECYAQSIHSCVYVIDSKKKENLPN